MHPVLSNLKKRIRRKPPLQGERSMTISSLLGVHPAYIHAQQRHAITIDGLFAQQMRKMQPNQINVSSLLHSR